MKIICAWCEKEGLQSLMGEKPPYSSDVVSHGMCEYHEEKFIEDAIALSVRRKREKSRSPQV